MPANQETRIKSFGEVEDSIWKNEEVMKVLDAAADSFINYKDGQIEIWAASRDWFLEQWNRDALISLQGILLSRGRFEDAKSLLRRIASYENNGLLPTKFGEGSIEYNNADVPLWFICALKSYLSYTLDLKFVAEMLPTVKNIIRCYINGTGYYEKGEFHRIFMDKDYLIVSPPRATWMDADGLGRLLPVTPRNGKAVEINALFYSSLIFAYGLEEILNYDFEINLKEIIENFKKSFNKKFWNKENNALYDVIEGDPHGNAIRPNMIFAVSHCNNLLEKKKEVAVFECIKEHLLSPAGLRTLSPKDPRYIGSYDTYQPIEIKDLAYHQGTAWPWLMGAFVDALAKIRRYEGKSEEEIKNEIRYYLAPLVDFCLRSPYKSLPELFSGDSPHEPGGTTSQAWSIAEILRTIKEYKLLE